ncbi:MAG: hypothetical protein PHW77_02285 [Eubacteriales bacterium]|nr:hypothetical protein [Eubacteriales bacterium]
MKDKFIARFTLAGAALSACEIPAEKRLAFAESGDIKNSLSVSDGERVIGYVIGSEAALIKAFLARGVNMYGVYDGKVEEEQIDRHVIKVFYIPERI